MANPQPKKHTRISNELVEAFARIRIAGNEWCVLWVILRNTYGWNRKEHPLSFSFLAKATGLLEPNVARAIRHLIDRKIVRVIQNDNSNINLYGLNKDYEQWRWVIRNDKGFIQNDKVRVIQNDKQQRHILKTYNIHEHFDSFWDTYPKKLNKSTAKKSWEKLKPTKVLLSTILKDIKRKRTSDEWQKQNGQFIPYPASYLNDRRWEDEEESSIEDVFK